MVLQVDVNKVWLSFSSVFLAFVFVFGNSLRNMYESVIFLFVMHPYDVGDALFISGDWCQVEEIALQYTQVVRYDGVKIWYPNYVLCAGAVMNITRSAKRWESFKVSCCSAYPLCIYLLLVLHAPASHANSQAEARMKCEKLLYIAFTQTNAAWPIIL